MIKVTGGDKNFFKITKVRGVVTKHFSAESSERFENEVEFYKFCIRQGLDEFVANLIDIDFENAVISLEELSLPGSFTVDEFSLFVDEFVTQFSKVGYAGYPRQAVEACYCCFDALDQADRKIARVTNVAVIPLAAEIARMVRGLEVELGERELRRSFRLLVSPVDFGCHNIGHDDKGLMRAFDFEFAGVDGLEKLLSDVLLSPAVEISRGDEDVLVDTIYSIAKQNSVSLDRLSVSLRCFALRWAAIVLRHLDRAMLDDNEVEIHEKTMLIEQYCKIAGNLDCLFEKLS